MTGSRTDGEAAAVKGLLALLLAGALVPIWIAPLPPLQDLPNHLLKVDILRRWMNGEPEVREIYALNLKLLANYTCYAVLLLLAPFFGLVTAARILLSIIVVGLPLSACALLRRVNPGNTLLALAVPALNFNLFLMMGNLNFCLALAILLIALRIFVTDEGRAGRWHLGFAAAATALYFTHGFVFLILCAMTVALLALEPRPGRAWRLLGLLPGIASLASVVLGTLHAGGEAAGALRPVFAPFEPGGLRTALVWLVNPHGWGPDTPFALAWVAAIAACTLATVAAWLAEWRRGDGLLSLARRNPWLPIALALGIAGLIAPTQLREWYHLRARFSALTALTLLAAIRLPRTRGLRTCVIVVFVVSALAIEARNASEFRTRGAQVQEYVGGIGAIEKRASIVPVENLEEGPKYRDNLHSWAWYVIENGGWSPYLHVQPSYNPLVYRVAPWQPGEGQPLGTEESIRRMAACYDYLLLWNPKPGDAAALDPFFTEVRSTPHMRIWRSRAGVRRSTPASDPACARATGS